MEDVVSMATLTYSTNHHRYALSLCFILPLAMGTSLQNKLSAATGLQIDCADLWDTVSQTR